MGSVLFLPRWTVSLLNLWTVPSPLKLLLQAFCHSNEANNEYREDVQGLYKCYAITLFYVYGCFAYMHVCTHCLCLVPVETRRGLCIPWNWSYSRLWATMWVLGFKTGLLWKCSHCTPFLKIKFILKQYILIIFPSLPTHLRSFPTPYPRIFMSPLFFLSKHKTKQSCKNRNRKIKSNKQ